MNNTKLVNLLRTFSDGEFKEYEKIVASTYFNKGRNYLPLLKLMKKFRPKFDNEKMTAEYLFAKIYPGKKFNKQALWNMNTALFNMAEEFLVQLAMKRNIFERNSYIQSGLYYRKLVNLADNKLKAMEHNLKSTGLGSNYFYNKIQMEIRRINLLFLEDRQHLVPGHVMKEGEDTLMYFLILLSNVINNINYNKLLFNTKFDIDIPYEVIKHMNLEAIIDYAKTKKFKYTFLMEMYYSFIMTAIKPLETSYFMKAKELFEKHSAQLEKGEREICLGILCNYCVYRVNLGEGFFNRMLFEVNLIMLKDIEEFRLRGMGKILYIQALRNALLIKENEWVKKYIEKYTPYLKTSMQKPMRRLADAFLAFEMNDFEKVIRDLSMVRFFDVRDKFYVKSLSLRAYYELNEIVLLHYNIDAAKQFTAKNPSLGKLTRTNFNKFLDALKKLLAVKEDNDLYNLEKLYNEVLPEKSMVNHSWVLKKIEELKKGAF